MTEQQTEKTPMVEQPIPLQGYAPVDTHMLQDPNQQMPMPNQYQVPMQQAPMQGYVPVHAPMMNSPMEPAFTHGPGQVQAPMVNAPMQHVPVQGYLPVQAQMGQTVAFAGGTVFI